MNSRFRGGRQPTTRAAVFLDRDGVIIRDVHFLRRPSQISFLPHVELLANLLEGYYLVVATNQSGIARKFLTEDDLLAIHSELVVGLAARGIVIDALYYCPHLPTAEVLDYRVDCNCRKPRPGMLLRAGQEHSLDLTESYMIGDSARDLEAGRAAKLRAGILIDSGPNSNRANPNLAEAVGAILGGAV